MKLDEVYSHRYGLEILQESGEYELVKEILEAPELVIKQYSASAVNEQVNAQLTLKGWAKEPEVHPGYKLTINAIKGRVGLTLQTGNAVRAFYDLMKFQVMHLNDRIDVAVLILPSSDAARLMGSNIANFGRVTGELALFKHVITCPCLLISFI